MISSTGTPVFTRVFASVSAKIPHLLETLWRLIPSYGIAASRSPGTWSLRAVFSMKVPVPPLQADCIDLLGAARPGGGEEDRLHVLAADLRHEPHVRMLLLDARGHGDDFLDELAADEGRDEPGARAGEEDTVRSRAQA